MIQVGAFERTGADWGRALEELVDKGLVVYKEGSATEHGETFEVIPSTAPSR